jgi:(3,5-dihydroxyphenyl)acetyl-CoA 1,2-dioxygenase
MSVAAVPASECLRAAGLGDPDIIAWASAGRDRTADLDGDIRGFSRFWQCSGDLMGRLPAKPSRTSAEAAAVELILAAAREHRERFLGAHVDAVYNRLTHNRTRFVRIEQLVVEAAAVVPGLTPTSQQLAADSGLIQRDKDGIEIDQGIFLAHVLASEPAGRHLCHAMLLPRTETAELSARLDKDGVVDLGSSTVRRRGQAVHVIMTNPRYLNAEDQTTLDASEIAVDLATLDPTTQVAVLRGGRVDHPKYRDRHLFGSGINLTHLYRGRIPFVWFLKRDMAFVHKLYRGVARPDAVPDDLNGTGIEKPWIAAVDGFAIGGHCQLLLTMDYVIAANDAYLTLPARKEGIIPGLANLRLPRFTGDRIARQAIQSERKLVCDSDVGRLVCDEIVPAGEVDGAIARVVDGLTSSGAVSAVGNRRALRIGQEPLDLFRRYCSAYARDQAYCHFSSALIANLERNWDARNRKD